MQKKLLLFLLLFPLWVSAQQSTQFGTLGPAPTFYKSGTGLTSRFGLYQNSFWYPLATIQDLATAGKNIYNSNQYFTSNSRWAALNGHTLSIWGGDTTGVAPSGTTSADNYVLTQWNDAKNNGNYISNGVITHVSGNTFTAQNILSRSGVISSIGELDAIGNVLANARVNITPTAGVQVSDFANIGLTSPTYFGTTLGDNNYAQQKYVNDKIAASNIPTNGLQTISPDSVGLGGSLTQDATIGLDGKSFFVYDATAASGYTPLLEIIPSLSALGYASTDFTKESALTFSQTGVSYQDQVANKSIVGTSYYGRNALTGNAFAQVRLVDSTAKAKADSVKNTSTLQQVTTAGNTTTLQIQAKNFFASGFAGQGYLDLPSQSVSPSSTTNRLKIYADSLDRLSWKNSTYRRTLQVPYPSDVTIRMPYGPNPTLADSAKVDALVTSKISGAVVKKIDLIAGGFDSMSAGGQYLSRIVSNLGGTTSGWGFNTFGIAGDRSSGALAKIGLITPGNYNTVIVLVDINDLFAGIPIATIEANNQSIYTALHNAGFKVIVSTILPCSNYSGWTSTVQTGITTINSWIKTTATGIDVVVDNYVLMADPTNPTALDPAFANADQLHPSDPAGYNKVGDNFYNSTTWTKKNFVYNFGLASDTRINQNLSTGDNVSFQRVNTSQIIVNNDRQYSTPWPAMATTLVTGVQTPTEAGAFYDTDKHLPGFYDGTSPRYLVWNGQATSLTINSDIIASSLYNSTSINNAYIQPSASGVKVQRNVADAVAAFTATQVNAGSTGNIQNWQFGGNVQAAMTYRGYLSIGASTTTSLLNVQQSTQGTGTISNSASGTTVTGLNTIFNDTFSVGQTITANGETHTISAIASNTSMTTDAWTAANSGVAYTLVGGSRVTVGGNGIVKIPTFTTAGIVHNAVTTGALSSSLIATADIANGAVTAAKADTTALQTVANFFPKGDTRYAKINHTTNTTAISTSTYTISATDEYLWFDTSTNAITTTLPTAVGKAGKLYTLKRTSAGANNVTIATTSSQTIDGITTYSLSTQWKYVTLFSNGANWLISANN